MGPMTAFVYSHIYGLLLMIGGFLCVVFTGLVGSVPFRVSDRQLLIATQVNVILITVCNNYLHTCLKHHAS